MITDVDGTVQWQAVPVDDGNYYSIGSGQCTSDGGYVLAGKIGIVYSDGYVVKADNQGRKEWSRTLGGWDRVRAVQELEGGGFIIAGGYCSFSAGRCPAYLAKLDDLGNVVWDHAIPESGLDTSASSVQQTSDGGFVLAGGTGCFTCTYYWSNMWLAKVDAAGELEWQRSFEIGTVANDVQLTSDNGFIIAGTAADDTAVVIKTDSTGNVQWEMTLDDVREARAILPTPDGGYLFLGETREAPTSGYNDIVVVKFGARPEPTAYDISHVGSPSSPTNYQAAEPVSVIFGNYTYQHTDLSIAGLGPAITFQRTYNSANPQDGPLGYGWTHPCAQTAAQETSTTVLVKNEDGRLDRFNDDGAGGYTPPPGTFNSLIKNPDDTFTLTHKDHTQYNFDASGRLASIVDKNGNTTTLTYTGDNLTSITDAAGRTITLAYDASGHITQITDSLSRTITYGYHASGNLISVTDARGKTTTYTYDDQHGLISITDANAHTFVQNTYDSQGRVIEQRDAKGDLTTFNYDPAARQTTVSDPLGNQPIYTYDANWRATGETDALGYTESYAYDEHNNRTSVTDKNGNTTHYAYDANGNTTVITDTMGYTTTMTYDAQNNLTSKTDALGRTTTYTYDANSNLISTTDPLANVTTFACDGFGQMISATDANGHTTQFAYDAYGYQTAISDALGSVAAFTYDIVGRKLTETDANGNTTTYTYDANNNLLSVTDALGGVTSYSYDNVGNRLSVTDPLGRVTAYAYDEKDRLVSITDAIGNSTTYAYDANDNRTAVTDAPGRTTQYEYDPLNRLNRVTDPLGNVTTYAYDANGNRTSVTDANGNTTTFAYDALNRLIQVIDPLGHSTSYGYDAVGNKTSVTDANGNTTSYAYDGLNRLISVTDALGGVVTYDYDPVRNKTSMTDANGHVTQYEYDPLNRLHRVTDSLGHTTSYGYDAVGNKTSLTDANGNATTYTYDALNRLTQITYPDGTVQYTYDAVGNRITVTDATGTTTYVYDALDRLTSVASPGGRTIGYAYDAVGNRTSITYPDGKVVTYACDAANRLTAITDWAGRGTSYTYDPVGNLTRVSYPNGTEASYTYDDASRLIELVNAGPRGTISSFNYTLDDAGNRTQVVEADGDVITYTYDALYRLTGVREQMRVDFDSNCYVNVADIMEVASRWRIKDTDPGWDAWYDLDEDGDIDIVDIMLTVVRWGESCESASYTYDAMGNRVSMTIPTGTITYTYDAADRLLNISDGTTFTWDANGNQLSKGSTNYTYDTANRLTQVTNSATTVQFTYDGDGKRASKTANGTSTSYLCDVNTALPVVLVESTNGGDILYTYGADLIAMTEPSNAQSYYHYDGLGSVRNLTDGSSAVIASYTYDAFGNPRLMKGSSDNTFKFTGEQTDDETGLIYLRARYYDPSVGRFISKDPLPGFDTRSQTLNRYVYAYNSPATYSDPSGQLVPLTAAVIGVPVMVGGLIAFLANPEVANAPTHNMLFLYKREPFKPVLHAVESVALSKLLGPLKPGITRSGLQGALAGLQKYSFGLLLGRMLDDFIYGDTRVLNPYYSPPGTMRPISPPSSGK